MSLFRRTPRPIEPAADARSETDRSTVEFVGIADSDLSQADFTPYQFRTVAGVWVRLHDMQCLGFDYDIRQQTLTIRFAYEDPEWTPPEARSTPVAVFRFSDVQVVQWEDDADLFETPLEVRGQVGDLEYNRERNTFWLRTLNTTLVFSASRLTVELQSVKAA